MKNGLTLETLASTLTEQMKSKRDFIAPASDLGIAINDDNKPVFEVGSVGTFEIGDVAHEQIADRNDIPRKYYNRMLAQSPELLARNVNHWFQSEKSAYLVRNLGGKTRALLSDRFRTLDNFDLADIAIPTLQKMGARIESCEVTERRFYLKAVTERLQFPLTTKVGDAVQAGICISNSEVGSGRLMLEPLIYYLVCANGMIAPDSSFKKSHLGGAFGSDENVREFFKSETRETEDRLFWMQVRDVIGAFFNPEVFSKIVDRFKAAKQEKAAGDPIKIVEVTAKKFGLTDVESGAVLASWLKEDDFSRFGLVNAVTYAAQGVESYDRSTELERLGGTILELPRKDWSIIAESA